MSDDEGGGVAPGAVRALVPRFVRERFALKFLTVLTLMGLAIGSVGLLATAEITDQTQQRIENEYSSLATQEATVVNQWIERNRQVAGFASNDNVWSSNETAAMERAAENVRRDSADISAIHVVDTSTADQRVVASTEFDAGTSFANSDRSWVGNLNFDRIGQVHVSSVYEGRSGPVIGFASPVGHGSERVLVIESSVTSLADRFAGSERAEGGFTQVVNGSGTILMDGRMAAPGVDGAKIFSTYGDQRAREPIRAALSGESRSGVRAQMPAHSDIIDEQYAVGFAALSITNGPQKWVVLVHAPSSQVFGFAQTVSNYGMFATGAAVLLMGLIGAILGYNTSRSIDRLTGKAEAIEAGDLDVDIATTRVDNIGRLYDAFASMRDSLRDQIDEAERARKEAEVSRAEAMEMTEYLQQRAEDYSETMHACARGDLTRRLEPEGENEAMDRIAEDFNEMVTELEKTTGQLKTFAEQVEEGGRSVQQSADTVRDASEQVADSIQKISDDAYDQKERLRAISEDVDEVAAAIEAFDEADADADVETALALVTETANTIERAVELGEETMAESETVAGAAEEQAAELNEVSSRAGELVRYAEYLGDGLANFETEAEHEFVFQTGAGGTGSDGEQGRTDD